MAKYFTSLKPGGFKMHKLLSLLLVGIIVLFFSCQQDSDPVSADISAMQIETGQSADPGGQNVQTPIQGELSMTALITWGQQGANPAGRYFIRGLQAEIATNGTLTGTGVLEQNANFDPTLHGPTWGTLDWTFDWNGEQVTVSGTWQGKKYLLNGVSMFDNHAVLNGNSSSGPVNIKMSLTGPPFGPWQYLGTVIAQ
jgi:hypothetical protein